MTLFELKKALLGIENDLEDPYLEVRVLLTSLGFSPSNQIAYSDKTIDDEITKEAFEDFRKRIDGTPMAYITHSKEFYGHDFYVDESVLIPRPDTETIVNKAIEIYKEKRYNGRILDLCTGSGAIAASISSALGLPVSFSDISKEALLVAEKNYINITGRKDTDARQGSLFEPWKGEKFSLIATNPPYLTQEWFIKTERSVKREPHIALVSDNTDGLDIIKKIVSSSPQVLEKNGTLLIECDYRQIDTLSSLLKENGFSSIGIEKDMGGLERVVYGEYKG